MASEVIHTGLPITLSGAGPYTLTAPAPNLGLARIFWDNMVSATVSVNPRRLDGTFGIAYDLETNVALLQSVTINKSNEQVLDPKRVSQIVGDVQLSFPSSEAGKVIRVGWRQWA